MNFLWFDFLSTLAPLGVLFPMALAAARSGDAPKNADEPNDSDEPADILSDFQLSLDDLIRGDEDLEQVRSRIDDLTEKMNAGQENLEKPLLHDYLRLALESQEEEKLDDSLAYFHQAIRVLKKSAQKRYSTGLARMVGLARLSYAITLNDLGRWEEALVEYGKAEGVMASLAEMGDLEAQLDLAGIRLNVATIQFEIGKTEEALTLLDRVKSDFSALSGTDKEDEARYYLAKAILLIASIEEDRGQERESVERMKEAIAIYRGLTEEGKVKYKYDLACAVASLAELSRYDFDDGSFRPEPALSLITEAVELFQESIVAGRTDACVDLLEISLLKGKHLFEMNRCEEAIALYDDLIETYGEFRSGDTPALLANLASAYSWRGNARRQLKDLAPALADLNEAIGLFDQTLAAMSHSCDVDDCHCEEHFQRFGVQTEQMLAYQLRAGIFAALGRRAEAEADCHVIDKMLESLRDYLDDEYESFRVMAIELRKQINLLDS